MVLGKVPVPGRPTNLDSSRTRACCTCSSCGWGLFGHFFYRLSFLSLTPTETTRYRLKYRLKGQLSPKQPINQGLKSHPKGQKSGGSNLQTLNKLSSAISFKETLIN